MEQQEFTYKSTFSYWSFLPAIIFAGIAGYCFINDIGIAYKNFRILPSPTSYYVTGGLSILFFAYAFYKLFNVVNTNKNKAPIKINNNSISFPIGKSNIIYANFLDIDELWIKDDSDDGESVIIYTKPDNDRHEFFADNFESTSKYIDFKTVMEKRCTNITNT